jgi:hypothetical protein
MSLFTLVRNRTSIRSPRGRAQDRPAVARFRPRLEALEDRCAPSTLKVTNTYDNGPGSLRYEIAHASSSGKDTIVFERSVLGRTINLYSQLNVTSGVTIQGPGAGLLTLTTNYNWGDPWGQSTRVFEVNAGRPVFLSGVTITDNYVNDQGGAILNHSTMTITGCNIYNNGAGTYGGGIANLGTMTVSNCTVSQDSAMNGGGIYNAGTMTVSGCTLSRDQAGGFGYLGDGIYNTGTLTVGNSTFIWDSISGSYTDGGGNAFGSARPQIGSFIVSPDSVTAGGIFTLTVTNLTDANPNSTITQVILHGYSDATFSTLYVMGYFTQSGTGVWTYTFSTAGWAPGTYTFFAVAVDNYGVWSLDASSNTVQIV